MVDQEEDEVFSEARRTRRWRLMPRINLNPLSRSYQLIGILLICLLAFGSYYVTDCPAALSDPFKNILRLSAEKYSLLFSIYNLPNALTAIFGGYVIDRFLGVRLGSVVFASLVAIGQVMFAFGVLSNQYWLMICGRFIFATGSISLSIAQNAYIVKWFKGGGRMNTVFGVQLSIASLASTMDLFGTRPMFVALQNSRLFGSNDAIALGFTLLLISITTLLSLLCALVLVVFDSKRDRRLAATLVSDEGDEVAAAAATISRSVSTDELIAQGGHGVITWQDVIRLPLAVWFLAVMCVTFFLSISPFVAFGVTLFERKYDLSPHEASICNSLIYLVAIFVCPIIGALIDHTGRNLVYLFVGTLLALLGHILFAFTFVNPYVAMVTLGLAYSTFSTSIWPSVALIVDEQVLGTAYGLLESSQNLGLGILFLFAGALVGEWGYLFFEMLLIACLLTCFCFCLSLLINDLYSNRALTNSIATRNVDAE